MKKLYTFCLMALMAIGMQAQITLVKDINPGISNSSPAGLFVFDGKIYFAADDAAAAVDHGKELWVSDGTDAGTVLVKDLNGTSANSTPGNFFVLNNELYFTSLTKTWKTDGTDANTLEVLASGIYFPKIDNDKVYYNNTVANSTFWVYDGTTNAAVVNNGTIVEKISGGNLLPFNNKVICYMEADAAIGIELYEYDPATGLFTIIKDITGDDANSSISNFTILDNMLYFEALGGLWQTDGISDGTIAVASASSLSGVANLYAWNGKLFFEGDNTTDGDELYVYDPSANTITMLSNIDGAVADHNPSDYCAYNGYIYYAGQDANDTKKHLFRTNGSVVEQINADIIDVDEIVELNGILYFEGEDATGVETTGNELFMFNPLTLGVADKAYVSNLSVYPNPTERTINIAGLASADTEYTLFDISGRTITVGVVAGQSIELDVKSGVYMLQLIDNGTKSVHKIQVK